MASFQSDHMKVLSKTLQFERLTVQLLKATKNKKAA